MSSDWVFTIFFPVIGTMCSNLMFSSSLLVIRLSRRQRFLGKALNPIPWAFGFVNSFAWYVYGVMTADLYLMSACAIGVLIGIFSCSTAFSLLGAARDEIELKYSADMETILMFGAVLWLFITYIMVATGDDSIGVFLVGIFATCTSILMYAAPMTTILTVIRLKDASSIYSPQVMANCLNGSCWTIYGLFGLGDVFVWLPSLFGVLVSVFMLIMKAIYPSNVQVLLLKDEVVLKEKNLKDDAFGTSIRSPLTLGFGTSTDAELDRKRGFSDLSMVSTGSVTRGGMGGMKYRGKLSTSSNDTTGVRSRTNTLTRGTKGYFDRNGLLVRVGSDLITDNKDQPDTSSANTPKVPHQTTRGRSATIQAVMELEDASVPPPSASVTKFKDSVGHAFGGVRDRAESILQMVEDQIITSFEPILSVEVVEANTNLQLLYQEQEIMSAGSHHRGRLTRERSGSAGSAGSNGSGGGYRPPIVPLEPLETILEPVSERDTIAEDIEGSRSSRIEEFDK